MATTMQFTRAAVADSLASLQAAAGATGNGTALDVKGWDGVLFQVTGSTPTATITFEGSADEGSTWVSIEAYNIANGTVATTTTAVGDFVATCAGLSNVRARISAWTSGSFTVGARGFPGAAAAALVGSSATSGGASNVNANITGQTAGTPTHTADATVDATAGGVTLVASNTARKAVFVQNVGTANIRVSVGGTPTTTNGLQLVAGSTLILESPFCPTGAIKAIREGSTSSTAAVLEIA